MFNRAPGQEALLIGGQRTDAGGVTGADHQGFIENKQIMDFVFVSLQLVKRIPNIGVFIAWVFKLQHRKRNAVNKADDIRPARLFAAADRELVNRDKAVLLHVIEVQQKRMVIDDVLPLPQGISIYTTLPKNCWAVAFNLSSSS